MVIFKDLAWKKIEEIIKEKKYCDKKRKLDKQELQIIIYYNPDAAFMNPKKIFESIKSSNCGNWGVNDFRNSIYNWCSIYENINTFPKSVKERIDILSKMVEEYIEVKQNIHR